MSECRHCKHSISSLVDYKPLLMCMFWRRRAHEACPEFEREPGSDDEISQSDDGSTPSDHFQPSM